MCVNCICVGTLGTCNMNTDWQLLILINDYTFKVSNPICVNYNIMNSIL